MDGVSDDFSGLPPRHRVEREPRRDGRNRGRAVRIALVTGFVATLGLIGTSLVVFFAPAPYLGVNHAALASSVDGSSGKGCKPASGGWFCWRSEGGADVRYLVTADWAGCWTGEVAGRPNPQMAGTAQPKISGCVSIIDHLTAD